MRIAVTTMFKSVAANFRADVSASIAPAFALLLIPIMTAVGAAVDYSRANNFKTKMQAALDSGLIAGAKDGGSGWKTIAVDTFNGSLKKASLGIAGTPSFTQAGPGVYQGDAAGLVDTVVLGLIKIPELKVSVKATATASEADNSCILTLDKGKPTSNISLTLNGAPVINLAGCSIRSNTSLDCNGHDGNVTKGIASGTATDCGKPKSYSAPVPDIYAQLATQITKQCGSYRPGVSWTPGSPPSGAGVKISTNNGRTAYHICGDLNLSGSGAFDPGSDALIIIENGSLNLANNASASISKTVVVMTGDNTYPSAINFPNGNGKAAKLTLSPPLDSTNPWHGVALFQDPALTNNVDNKWGPGADFSADGLVYLGNSNVVTDGNTTSSNAKCTKFVMNSFTTNGSVKLDFDQSVASCAAIGLKQWGGIIVHLIK
jgi:hypothetical protein